MHTCASQPLGQSFSNLCERCFRKFIIRVYHVVCGGVVEAIFVLARAPFETDLKIKKSQKLEQNLEQRVKKWVCAQLSVMINCHREIVNC